MFGNQHMRRMMDRDIGKPKRVSETLARFGEYFKPYWYILVLVAVLVVIATWAQVTAPELTGQLVDCYLTPTASSAFGGKFAAKRARCGGGEIAIHQLPGQFGGSNLRPGGNHHQHGNQHQNVPIGFKILAETCQRLAHPFGFADVAIHHSAHMLVSKHCFSSG